jgi:Photosynthesis system II assembly factor YCF48
VIAFMVVQLPEKHPQQSSNRPTSSPSAQEAQEAKATPLGDQPTSSEAKAAAPMQPTKTRSETVGGVNLAVPAKEIEKRRAEPTRAKAAIAAMPPAPVLGPPPATPAKMAVLTAGLQKKDYVNTNFFTSSSADNVVLDRRGNSLPPAPQPQPTASNSAFSIANSKITNFADLPANAAGKSNVRILSPAPPQEHLSCTVCKIVQSTAHTLGFHSPVRTPALRSGALSSSALGGPGMFSGAIEKNQPAEISAAPTRADADGFAASSSLSASAMAPSGYRSADSASPMWKVVGGKLMKSSGPSQWEDAYPVASSTMEFSFVNARGNDVWAGGGRASMIHSRDGGLTWETVKLGDNASGTIVSIIAGAMSVQVKTSDNQTWSSTDGGKTWTLRGE